ncbi:MAG TPA: Smr/MutS family protein [Gallionella sp.]
MVKKPLVLQADPIASEDIELFRSAVGKVSPIAQPDRITPLPPRKPPFRQQPGSATIPDTLTDFVTGEPPDEYLSNGLSRMTLRKLRKGSWPVRDHLDLHGMDGDAARKLLQAFLHEAIQRNYRCVLVIHGKGLNSPGGEAVLRKLTRHWLAQHPRVLAFCNAASNEGGSGAAVVLLKSSS